ncbi:MAG: hypothetical protein AB1481_06545 [Candidatus Omnitrophota bacterium]
MLRRCLILAFSLALCVLRYAFVYATPSTHIWAPSTDIQPYKKIHITSDFYFPTTKKDASDNHLHVNQVYGLTFSLLSTEPEKNLLGKLWSPLGKIMAETGFDYKKGYGSVLDTYPWYFHLKAGVPEDAYFKNMPAFAVGIYDIGTKHNKTDNNVSYFKFAKTVSLGDFSLGRFSAGYFRGNDRVLRDQNDQHDHHGALLAWERTMSEISDKLWLCVDYQGTHSAYGAVNYGFAWKFTDNISAIIGYDIYNNRNLTDTVTLQVDIDF